MRAACLVYDAVQSKSTGTVHAVLDTERTRTLFYTRVGTYGTPLRAGRSRDRIPVGARYYAPVQTGLEAHPASYAMGTGFSRY